MQAPIVPPLLDLPLDLLVVVLVPLLPLSSLSSLLRTCSAIHTQLRPLLYHTLDLRAPAALEAFARAHSTTDDSLPFVRHLLVPNQPYKTLHAFLSAFLPSFPELHTLHLPLSDLTDTSPLLALPPACTVSITSSDDHLRASALHRLLHPLSLASIALTPSPHLLRHPSRFIIPFTFIQTGHRLPLPPTPPLSLKSLEYYPASLAADLHPHPNLAKSLTSLTLHMPHLTPSTTAALLSLTSLRTLKILEPAPLTTPHSLPAHTTPSFTSLHALTIGAAWSPTVRMLYSPYAPLLPGNLQLSILRTNRRLKHLSLLTLPPQEVLLLPRTLETLEVLFPTDLQVLSELDLPRLHSVRISGVRLCVREVRAVARMAPALVEFLFMGWDTGEEREPGVGDVAAWKAWRDRVKRWVCANDKTLEVLGASIDVKFDQYSTEVWCEMGKAALQELRETVLEEPVRATGPEEQMKETGLDVMEKPMKETPLEEPRGLAEEICFH